MKYDKVFITSQASFYKISLWNEVAKHRRIFVLFTEISAPSRNADFYNGNIQFDHSIIIGSRTKQSLSIVKWFIHNKADEIIFGGWDRLPSLIMAFLSKKVHNSTILESSIFESKVTGLKSLIKKAFMRRMSKVYAPGLSNAKLSVALGKKDNIILTGGCGILNYINQPNFTPKACVQNFIFVGRLIPIKNLELLINVFNSLPQLKLTIVGFGELEMHLKSLANENIVFTGAIANKDLSEVYQQQDVFILPSKSETWGLVVEEALNNGLPVIVSDRVGCGADLATPPYGLVFKYDSAESLRSSILKMTDTEYYNNLRLNISKLDFKKRAQSQVNAFCH
jgi:glycosyltransferase involved in cell wall biosynthesis